LSTSLDRSRVNSSEEQLFSRGLSESHWRALLVVYDEYWR